MYSGWSDARSAILFRHIAGSYSDYAIGKLNLLLNFNSKMHNDTKIGLIVIGLPIPIQEKNDKSEIPSVSKLL